MRSNSRVVGSAAAVLVASVAVVVAQQPGHQKPGSGTPCVFLHPSQERLRCLDWINLSARILRQPCVLWCRIPLPTSQCTAPGQCTTQNTGIVIDAQWGWLHKKGDYHNCYTGDSWNKADCPDPKTCAQNCAIDAGGASNYKSTYGVTSSAGAVTIDFEESNSNGKNVGARLFLMEDQSTYKMFKLLNKEMSFTVDVSKLPCGMNGALYLVDMDPDGGMSKYPTNTAGAAYGTGYCDAQCPHDMKMINGQANIIGWTSNPKDPNSGKGSWGSCCSEMDSACARLQPVSCRNVCAASVASLHPRPFADGCLRVATAIFVRCSLGKQQPGASCDATRVQWRCCRGWFLQMPRNGVW